MFHALLHGKLDGEFRRDPYSIEDLLTSVVIGACAYVPAEIGLLPFIEAAKSKDGVLLESQLQDVQSVEYCFWPSFGQIKTGQASSDLSDSTPAAVLAGGEPDVVLKLTHKNDQRSWLVLEAKLFSGKSSLPDDDRAEVTDQLGKYWLQLEQRAHADGAKALGVVYLTKHLAMPKSELTKTQVELRSKHQTPAPLYWLSWRQFPRLAKVSKDSSGILKDVVKLMRKRWQLIYVSMKPWPAPPSALTDWSFKYAWQSGHDAHAPTIPRSKWSFDKEPLDE